MHNKNKRISQAFTLVELLTVITIIGLMSGMFLIAYQGAAQESNAQKTRTTIQKISDILNSRMEEYSSYPLVLKTPFGTPLPSSVTPILATDSKTLLLERARLLCLRELIAMEMPDNPDDLKWSDKWGSSLTMSTFLNGVPRVIPTGLAAGGSPYFVQNKPSSRVFGLARKLSGTNGQPIPGWQTVNANAELLYLIIEDSDIDGSSAIEMFGASEIRDSDNDGLKEFVDAYGRPIQWIRWPTGYEGIARYHPDMLDPGIITGSGASLKVTIESDPLDRMAADPGYVPGLAASLVPGPGAFPLVMSAGLDGQLGIRIELASPTMTVGSISSYSLIDSQWTGPGYLSNARFTDPWSRNLPADRLGSRTDTSQDSFDNITNYDGNGASL